MSIKLWWHPFLLTDPHPWATDVVLWPPLLAGKHPVINKQVHLLLGLLCHPSCVFQLLARSYHRRKWKNCQSFFIFYFKLSNRHLCPVLSPPKPVRVQYNQCWRCQREESVLLIFCTVALISYYLTGLNWTKLDYNWIETDCWVSVLHGYTEWNRNQNLMGLLFKLNFQDFMFYSLWSLKTVNL